MVLANPANGVKLMDGSEQTLFIDGGLKHYATRIFFNELVAGDEIIVRVYDLNPSIPIEHTYRTVSIEGSQTDPAVEFNWLQSDHYRISCEQINQGVGGNKSISFKVFTS